MEVMEEILPPLQHQLQEASPPPKVQLGQQDQQTLRLPLPLLQSLQYPQLEANQLQQDAMQDGLLTGIVMTSTTVWNVLMMEETAVDLT